ncbi:MAG: UDP-N-acetylmuramoyl-L-alanyl-D-glutamate--2,6-diaminopimelate ligase [Oscillospiraceae bacterium]|nr:UDP-N-acetylmuramoyl-L-alanyl-D-glutamate--2,6-diaminopimelate ligase [Oscillospiraceae bacterium]
MRLTELWKGVALTAGDPALDLEITGLACHSREIQPGGLFVAVPGQLDDGHRFIEDAVRRGAAAVVCQHPPGQPPGVPVFQVPDSRAALSALAANFYRRPGEEVTLIGVTGTNGKTTTTYLIKQLLEGVLNTKAGLIGTNQNLIGGSSLPAAHTTPDSLELQSLLRRMADGGCTHVVMEVSSHALALERTAGLTFDAGIFTNLTQDHLDFHRTMEAYRDAKERLFQQSRTAVFNLDDEAGRYYASRRSGPMFTYSEARNEASLCAKNLRLLPGRVEFEALTGQGIARVKLPIPGGFTIYNALAALSCGLVLGLELEAMAAALAQVQGVRGRVEVVPCPAEYTVIIDYAHTPDALENLLCAARCCTKGRILLVFGCGGDRDRSKRPLMGQIAGELADYVIVTSDNPRTEDPMEIIRHVVDGMDAGSAPHEVVPDRREAIFRALDLGKPGDLILLAGKGHETDQLIGTEKRHLDEREEVARYFHERT